MAVVRITPMLLLRIPEPFDQDDFIFEVKFDGFRALAHIDGGRCALISRSPNLLGGVTVARGKLPAFAQRPGRSKRPR